jgi:hypothetical protein
MHEPDAASRVAPAHVPPATAFGETATLVLLPVVFFLGIVTIARLDHRIAAFAFWDVTRLRGTLEVRFPTPPDRRPRV